MKVTPTKEDVKKLFNQSAGALLYTRLVADLETPVSTMMKLGTNRSYSCLLESVEGGSVRGRFSIIAIEPDIIWKCENKTACKYTPEGKIIGKASDDVFTSLAELIEQSSLDIPDDLPPMAAGLFGYFGYEMVHHIESLPDSNPDLLNVPDAILMRPSIVIIFDRLKDVMTICTPLRPNAHASANAGANAEAANASAGTSAHAGANASPETLWQEGYERLEKTVAMLETPLKKESKTETPTIMPEYTSNMEKTAFLEMVKKGVDYIKLGDIFQVALSQRFSIPYTLPPINLYRALRRLNPSPFLIFFNMDDMALVGSSPEILVRLRDGDVTIRPAAGTRPRGKTYEQDQALADELLADTKERAEHLMLLDLGRNDTGRVSEVGTVRVVENFTIERYSHVMHIVSEVKGKIRAGLGAIDALKAGFPAGTVSGAPKVRAMEIIDELEPCRRGPYSGAAGYISADGDMDTCITLRTAIIKDGKMHIQAGAGIVYDSVPEKEFLETENKAMALIRAAAESNSLK